MVTQFFTIELPEGTVNDSTLTLTRSEAERLYTDLGEALHPEGVRGAEESVQEVLAGFLAQLNTGGYEQLTEDHPVGQRMSPDEALARAQAQAQIVPSAPVRNPGTMIGNA